MHIHTYTHRHTYTYIAMHTCVHTYMYLLKNNKTKHISTRLEQNQNENLIMIKFDHVCPM